MIFITSIVLLAMTSIVVMSAGYPLISLGCFVIVALLIAREFIE